MIKGSGFRAQELGRVFLKGLVGDGGTQTTEGH